MQKKIFNNTVADDWNKQSEGNAESMKKQNLYKIKESLRVGAHKKTSSLYA